MTKNKITTFLFENKVVVLFVFLCIGGTIASGQSMNFVVSELFTRIARNSFLVLALIIPVLAGLGLNFGIVIGAMAVVMAAFGRGAQGLDGVKSLATIGGAITLLIFALMVISAIKVFFGKQTEDIYSILEEEE